MNLRCRKYAAARCCQRENTDVTSRDSTKRDGIRPHIGFTVVRLINTSHAPFTMALDWPELCLES